MGQQQYSCSTQVGRNNKKQTKIFFQMTYVFNGLPFPQSSKPGPQG